MTLVLGVYGPKSIWLLTDRRLSCRGRPHREDARKMMFLEATDGVALLGYAGLGATALGTEPADWMARVVRGLNLPLEKTLGVLTDAIQRKLPSHLDSLRSPHHVIVPAFLRKEGRLYSIDLVRASRPDRYVYRYTRHVIDQEIKFGQVARRVVVGGSGALALMSHSKWVRDLRRTIKAHDESRITPNAVAVYLAHLNYRVHTELQKRGDRSVGPHCVVAWRLQEGGGAHQFFNGLERENNPAAPHIPAVVTGMDLNGLLRVMMPHMLKNFEAARLGEDHEMDRDAMNAELAQLPHAPDDTLQ
jgi:hypothetical protein